MSTSETTLIGNAIKLTGNNYIKLNLKWREEVSGNNNIIYLTYYATARYRINGTWTCRMELNNNRVASGSVTISHGSNTSEYSGSTTIFSNVASSVSRSVSSVSVKLYIDNMDYTSVSTGSSMRGTISQSFQLSLSNYEIIPGKPTIAIESPSDGNGRSNYTVYQSNSFGISGTFRLYPCQSVSEVSASNKLRFTVGKPSNSTNVKIYLSRYVNGSGWNHNYYVTNWNGSSFSFEKEFSSSDRYDKGVAWRVRTEAISSTGNLSESDHIYFIINDLPVFSNNEPNISCPQIVKPSETSCNISWTSAINTAFATTYKLRYKNSAESNWNEVNTSSTSYSLNISGKNYNRGSEVSFEVKALDSYDGDLDFRGLKKVKINELPYFNSSTISTNNNKFLDDIIFTIPEIKDNDLSQILTYNLEYSIGNNEWTVYKTNLNSSTITINCSNYQQDKNGTFQLRAIAYDGMEYSENYIYSPILTKDEIIPDKPTITIELPDDGNGRIDYTIYQSNSFGINGSYRLYPCQSKFGLTTSNKLKFVVNKPSNSTSVKIYLSKYVNGSWNYDYYVTDWKESSFGFSREFNYLDRYDKGIAWRVKAEAISSTDNLIESDYIYFIINDLPVFSNNEPNISCPQIVKPSETFCNISWTSAINTAFATTYKLRYKNSAESNWNEVNVTSNKYSLNISNKNYNRGSEISFRVKALDSYDSDINFYGSAKIKINELPYFNSSLILVNTNEFLDNVTFTIPEIKDNDLSQTLTYNLEYSIGNNEWTVYKTNLNSSTITINCSNYQKNNNGTFQLRAIAYDGIEYSENYIYSPILTKSVYKGYTKINGKYLPNIKAFIKINGKYVEIKETYIKNNNIYKT